jgi:hypothetical protein
MNNSCETRHSSLRSFRRGPGGRNGLEALVVVYVVVLHDVQRILLVAHGEPVHAELARPQPAHPALLENRAEHEVVRLEAACAQLAVREAARDVQVLGPVRDAAKPLDELADE